MYMCLRKKITTCIFCIAVAVRAIMLHFYNNEFVRLPLVFFCIAVTVCAIMLLFYNNEFVTNGRIFCIKQDVHHWPL